MMVMRSTRSKTRRLESQPPYLYLLGCKFQDFFSFTNPCSENMGQGEILGDMGWQCQKDVKCG